MKNVEALFKNKSFDKEKLLSFGFKQRGEQYVYARELSEPFFEARIVVCKGEISTDVFDTETGDVYVPVKIPEATGSFVGKIREELEGILSEISEACCSPDVFKSPSTQKIIRYVQEKYQGKLEFLWPQFPQNAIFRRQDNAKWYAAILSIAGSKLGLPSEEEVEIIDLRGKTADIAQLVDGKKYFRGWHMNKKHWFTICLDGSVPIEEICHRVDESYLLAKK